MLNAFRVTDLTWSFLRAIVTWSIVIAAAIAVGSCVAVCDPRFTATFLVAATLDVATLAYILRFARRYLEGTDRSSTRMISLLSVRLISKGILLGLAAFLPEYLDFLGMVLGVLLVDTTVLVIGSITAALRMPSYHRSESSRKG